MTKHFSRIKTRAFRSFEELTKVLLEPRCDHNKDSKVRTLPAALFCLPVVLLKQQILLNILLPVRPTGSSDSTRQKQSNNPLLQHLRLF